MLKGFVKGPIASSRVMKISIYETVAIKFLKSEEQYCIASMHLSDFG